MLEIVADLIRTIVGLSVVLIAWFGLQALVRRNAGKPAEEDVLEHLAHGCCGGCSNAGKCSTRKERTQHESA